MSVIYGANAKPQQFSGICLGVVYVHASGALQHDVEQVALRALLTNDPTRVHLAVSGTTTKVGGVMLD
jgi:hypothetical protein